MADNKDPLNKLLNENKTAPRSFNTILVIIVVAGFAVLMIFLSTEIFRMYGWALFVALPFLTGFYSSLLASLEKKQRLSQCVKISISIILVTAIILVLLAFEGIICIVMALLPTMMLTLIGTVIGYWIQKIAWNRYSKQTLTVLIMFIFPLILGVESKLSRTASLNKVQSSIVINASKQIVWDEVVTSDLPPPDEFIFKTGIAYPIKAQIDGKGVGAVRYCIFSTGKFVEPIEVWDKHRLLKFSVTHSPPPMKELSIYSDIHPPHLDGFLKSEKGQFKLMQIDKNTTLLEGTTWYENKMWPEAYWKLLSDYIIGKIHNRVLKHIKASSESLYKSL
jgi:hypothetical protein